jgi:hypothetical protein
VVVHVQGGQEGVGVGLVAADLDGGADGGLLEDEGDEVVQVEDGVVDVEQLAAEGPEAQEVYGGLRVEELELDVEHLGVLGLEWSALRVGLERGWHVVGFIFGLAVVLARLGSR